MREILFRAKRLDNGKWVCGFLVPMWGQMHIIDRDFENTAYLIDESTLCQYTGLKDKNGNRIWENDIVRIENSMDDGIGNIEFYGGMWYVDGEPSNTLYDIIEYDDIVEMEVVGNIFDNPELMKGD